MKKYKLGEELTTALKTIPITGRDKSMVIPDYYTPENTFLGFPIVRTEQEEVEVEGIFAKYNTKEERWVLMCKFDPNGIELWKRSESSTFLK
jgi:hypothetical protein